MLAVRAEEVDLDYKLRLQGSLLEFTRVFYYERTGRKFELSNPAGRESHYISICRELTRCLRGDMQKAIINVPPRYGKTELLIHFIAWAMAIFPDSNFIYVSYSHSLAKKQTQTIREIIQLPLYRKLFGVSIKDTTNAKDNFETVQGGSVYAAGAGGTITGRGAGIKGCNRFGGCVVIDDIHKPDEAASDVIRAGVNDWYYNTLQSRVNNPLTPIIFIGQRLHEDDLAANLITTNEWNALIIPALDEYGNVLHAEMHNREALRKMEENSPYTFAAQYQQNPQPAGGGLFKPEWFVIREEEPNFIATFITGDTAETEKTYNDPSAFSFWGLYKIMHGEIDTGLYGIHLIDCIEIHVDAGLLEAEFMNFYYQCMMHKCKPMTIGIEKKSTGATLLSIVKKLTGVRVLDLSPTVFDEFGKAVKSSKVDRFIGIQQYVASRQISVLSSGKLWETKGDKRLNKLIEHMRKITPNNSHRHDDIADTLYYAIKLALIDKIFAAIYASDNKTNDIVKAISNKFERVQKLRSRAYGKN